MDMKKLAVSGLLGLVMASAPLLVWAQDGDEAAKPEVNMQDLVAAMPAEVDEAKASYAIGLNLAYQLQSQKDQLEQLGMGINIDEVLKGVQAGLSADEEDWAMTKDEAQTALQAYFQQAMLKQMAEAEKKQAELGKTAGVDASSDFLKKNAEREGVVVLPSGLQYEVIEEGEGDSPTEADTVKVDYEGKLVDGTVFDSSFARGEPIEFPLNGVIKGWTEGLQYMKPGATYMLYIPSDLGYGERGAPPNIPANAALIFKVQLHDVKKASTE
ncbi:Peptidyl-prolyl cis-trans isomerase Mip precursor [Poriferisphaera corsica]|uniref:Peptidyl-prolyl cis-trans isomerase n=1 Tax=Poriferisphaera corsica TaxID=2528020 RepID=A0A517YX79_9BACT|nr:FKBP-type peptidyl-prolyl cis-trans isomerase [Poriferisphaera corsica]QDU34832.1 Peptidyl-prolyl cis-trans isomerase Mip precursor [Poriferisphaera corsica]